MDFKTSYKLLFLCSLLLIQKIIAAPALPAMVPIDKLTDQITVATGEEPGDGFAESILLIGDINGDGLDDFAFSGPIDDKEEPVTYNVYIFYGRKKLPETIKLSQSSSWGIHLYSRSVQRSTRPVKGMGDVNGDGFDDLLFNPCAAISGDPCPGYILFGGPDLPTSIDTETFEGCSGCELYLDTSVVTHEIKRFDCWTSGDFNDDAHPDLVISSSLISPQGFPDQSGLVYVIFGSDSYHDSIDLTEVGTTTPGCRISSSHENWDMVTGEVFGSYIGDTVCGQYDFNADAIADLIIAAPRWNLDSEGREGFCGAIFVLLGKTQWPSFVDLNKQEDRSGWICFISSDKDRIGSNMLQAVQDAGGVGTSDLLVSGGGNTYLISGRDIIPGDYNIDIIKETLFVSGSDLFGTAIGDWSGDGINDFCFRSPNDHVSITGCASKAGAVHLLEGQTAYPREFFLATHPESYDKIIGASEQSRLGEAMLAADLTGNGRKEIVVSAPGFWGFPDEERPVGKLYIIAQETELLRPLVCGDYAPGSSNLDGGTRIYVTGKGFDDQTKLYIGSQEAEILEGSHSRQLIAEIPEVDAPASVPVRVNRGTETCTFEDEFAYYASIFPREVNVLAMGNQGCTVYEPHFEELPDYFQTSEWHFKGSGGDFTGDGLGDILITYRLCCHFGCSPTYSNNQCTVYLIHGAENLPEEIRISEEIEEWATSFQTNETGDCDAECFGESAKLLGDMNGDGTSELMVSASYLERVYLILGGAVPKGVVNIYELFDEGRCIVIEDCYGGANNIWVTRCGDLNGDGLADAGIVLDLPGSGDDVIGFVLGREDFSEELSFSDLPKLVGKSPENGMSRLCNFDALGDVNGDGFDDLGLHVVKHFDNNPDKGDVDYTAHAVFWGRASFEPITTYEEELANGGACIFVRDSDNWDFHFGKVGDQNGDGFADIGLSTYLFSPEIDPSTGKFRVIYGGGKEKICKERSISKDGDFDVTFTCNAGYNGMIWSVSGGKDLNTDNKPEILLADFHQDSFNGAPPPGRAITIFGGDLEEKAGPLADLVDAFELVNYESNKRLGYRFPFSFDFAGDVNGDGYEDLVAFSRYNAFIYFNPLGTLDMYFVRGDVNQDGSKNIADVITVLEYLFAEKSLLCFDAADINDDEAINIADPIYLLSYLFAEGNQVPPPVECGSDPEGNKLGCAESICQQVIVE